MKLNIAYPPYKAQKLLEIDDERKLRVFYDKRISDEVPGDSLGEEFKGYTFRISGGHDKQGFAMKQGVAVNHRVRLLLDGASGQYNPHRHGERRRKSVRGCIVGNDLSVLSLVIIKRGPADLAGLTDADSDKPSTRGPKRASNIRKVYALSKEDDVRQFVVRKVIKGKDGKKDTVKSPRIQRLVTPAMLQHKRRRVALKKRRTASSQSAKAEYNKIVTQLRKERRQAALSKKKSSKKEESVKVVAKPAVAVAAKKDTAKSSAAAPKPAAVKKDAKATGAAPAKGNN
jgi:small subunit ribosomal protein S6e